MRITYTGAHDGVELAALTNVVVERGQTIEVDDDLGARLVEQSCWDTSPDEILGWIHQAEDIDDTVDRARRMLTAEENGAQRADLIELLHVWLAAQAAEPDTEHSDDVAVDGTVSPAGQDAGEPATNSPVNEHDNAAADTGTDTGTDTGSGVATDQQPDSSTAKRPATARKGAK